MVIDDSFSVAPNVKHLFKGYDVTLFAYGVTGTGKTHTMRGGKSFADRGVIPRLLSSIYRRARKIEKDSEGSTQVEVKMSYYEIYNDKVFDLFSTPESRTLSGLPLREQNGKTTVVGLTSRPCTTLKNFETLYDEANLNRSTSATKLNAHSSRSHAVLSVTITQTTGSSVRESTASAIDLAGSEDNRRTDNNGERMVESASINKSLFVLAQCVEAISKKQARIPYRESKMTRILGLGQREGVMVMILNLAPTRSYHLDTLGSLNFANRTRKIEVREVENIPFFKEPVGGKSKAKAEGYGDGGVGSTSSIYRQPLRPKMTSQSVHEHREPANFMTTAKPVRQFAVYTDKSRTASSNGPARTSVPRSSSTMPATKRKSSEAFSFQSRPTKFLKTNPSTNSLLTRRPASPSSPALTPSAIEALITRKVSEALAERPDRSDTSTISNPEPLSEEMIKRLEALEKRVEGQEPSRTEGLQFLLMAKQHALRGEEGSALRMYEMALPFFPGNGKLERKVDRLRERLAARKAGNAGSVSNSHGRRASDEEGGAEEKEPARKPQRKRRFADEEGDDSYHEAMEETREPYEEDDEFLYRPKTKIRRPRNAAGISSTPPPPLRSNHDLEDFDDDLERQTPRTKYLLHTINTRDIRQIQCLKGVGAKRAEAMVQCLDSLRGEGKDVASLRELAKLKGVGLKGVENMRVGVAL